MSKAGTEGTRAHALVVDDEADNRELLANVLRREGYQVEEAADGLEALARLGRDPLPAIVLVDLMMPRMDGCQLLATMAATPRLSALPTIAVSACGPDALARAPATARIGKPIDLDLLLRTVSRLLDPPRSVAAVEPGPADASIQS